jgi:hypothetical protein
MTTIIKTITYQLSPVTVEVKGEGNLSDKEFLEIGKQKVIEQITKKFPAYKYGISEGEMISDDHIKLGRPVKDRETGEIGIIYDVKPTQNFPIKVAFSKGIKAAYKKQALEKPSKKVQIEKLITGRQEWEKKEGFWDTGHTAYFVNGKEIIPVVISANKKTIKAIIVSHAKGGAYSLTHRDLHRFFDSLEEAEKAIANQ